MEMTTVKTFAVMAVIFGCFAILYPKIFHPVVTSVFGIGSSPKQSDDSIVNRLPPHLNKPQMGTPKHTHGGGPHDDVARHMRAGPHPGMRAAAEMQKQANTQGSGGKGGMMTVVLPLYAIGIVVYLVYTLSKVFGGKKKSADDDYVKRHFNKRQPLSDVRYDADRRKFLYGQEDSEEEEEEEVGIRDIQKSRKQQRDLERLLFKADREKISDLEMHELKRRLLETESQMTRILQAMETVQDSVVDHVQGQEGFEEKENRRPTRQPQKIRKKDPRKLKDQNSRPAKKAGNNSYTESELNIMEDSRQRKTNLQKKSAELQEKSMEADEEYSDDFEDQADVVEEIGAMDAMAYKAEHDSDEDREEDGEWFKENPSENGTEEEEQPYSEENQSENYEEEDEKQYLEEQFEDSESGESIPEEIEDEFDDLEDDVEGGESEGEQDEGPTEEEFLQKLHSKRGGGKGKTKENLNVGEKVGGVRGTEEEELPHEYADVIDTEQNEQNSKQVQQDVRRRRKPPKDS